MAAEADEATADEETEDGEYEAEDARDDDEEMGTEAADGCARLLIVVRIVGGWPACERREESCNLVISVLVLLAAVTSDVSSPTKTVHGAAEYQ